MRPTRQSLLLLASGLLFALPPSLGFEALWPALPIFWAAMIAIHGLDLIASPRPAGLRWDLSLPAALHVGADDTARLQLQLPRCRRALEVQVRLEASDELGDLDVVGGRLGREPVEFAWVLSPRRRGTATVEEAWVRYGSPLGFWWWTRRIELQRTVPVLPNIPLLRSTALRFFSDPSFRAGLKIERYEGDGTEFESLRDFQLGDDHRTIDWKASARHRMLLCRQFRAERNHQVVLAVDCGRLMSEPLHGLPRLDHALNAALVLAYVCLRSGDRVGLFSFDGRVGPGMDPLGGVTAMRPLLELASRLRYSSDETNFTLGLATLGQRLRRRSLIILLTDMVDTITAELLLDNLDRIGRRHVIVFVSLRDPLLVSVADTPPSSPRNLVRSVVADSLLQDREVVNRKLRRLGVFSLDVEPGQIGPALINRYLEIKRRELI